MCTLHVLGRMICRGNSHLHSRGDAYLTINSHLSHHVVLAHTASTANSLIAINSQNPIQSMFLFLYALLLLAAILMTWTFQEEPEEKSIRHTMCSTKVKFILLPSVVYQTVSLAFLWVHHHELLSSYWVLSPTKSDWQGMGKTQEKFSEIMLLAQTGNSSWPKKYSSKVLFNQEMPFHQNWNFLGNVLILKKSLLKNKSS